MEKSTYRAIAKLLSNRIRDCPSTDDTTKFNIIATLSNNQKVTIDTVSASYGTYNNHYTLGNGIDNYLDRALNDMENNNVIFFEDDLGCFHLDQILDSNVVKVKQETD